VCLACPALIIEKIWQQLGMLPGALLYCQQR
jgi:hypothetical protein